MRASALSSGKVYAERKPKSLWEKICEEFDAQRAEYEEQDIDDTASISTDVTQFSTSRHTPVVYGKMVHETHVDSNVTTNFDPAMSHPAAVGLSLLDRPKQRPATPASVPPDPKSSSAGEYLEAYVFPTLIPAMIAMLEQARVERCFERKRTKFNACDFLTEYLYRNNPHKVEDCRSDISLLDISFVKEHLVEHPRPPLPLSLLWSEEEAAIKIQSYWRGYLVRVKPDVQEMRQWQREWREENTDVRQKVDEFWKQQETKILATPTSDSSKSPRLERKSLNQHNSPEPGRKSNNSFKT